MIPLDSYIDQLFNNLALGRFFFHKEEVRKAVQPIFDEIYKIGYDQGVADNNKMSQAQTTANPFDDVLDADLLGNEG